MEPKTFSEWLAGLPWWASTIVGIILGAFQILYPLWITGEPITTNMIIGAILTTLLGVLFPGGVKVVNGLKK